MKYKVLLISLWTLTLFSCTKEEIRAPKDSDRIYVNVSYNNEPIEGAHVFIEAENEILTTNNLGIAILNGSFNKSDTVYAYKSTYGGAKAKIKKNEGTNYISLQLLPSVLPKDVPVVQVHEPKNNDIFLLNETVLFSIDGSSVENNKGLEIAIISNIDGVLFEGTLPEGGILDLSENDLSIGLHTIQISATIANSIKYTKTLCIQYGVPEKIQLLKAERKFGSVELSWERSLDDHFKSYDIYISNDPEGKTGLKKVAQIQDRNHTTYKDTFPPFNDEVYYFIRVKNYLGLYNNSNLIKVEKPNGEIIDLIPDEAFVTKNQADLILWNKNKGKLVNYDLYELKINFQKDLPSNIVDIDVDQEEEGNIYAVDNTGKIYVYSSQDLSLLKEVSYSLSTFGVMYMGNNKVMLSNYSYGGWNEYNHVVDLSNGSVVSKTGNDYKLVFRKIPGKNAAISLTTTIIPIDMAYYEWDNDGKIILFKEDSQHGDYPLNSEVFAISDLGNYCISHSNGAIYTADDKMTYKGQLNSGYYSQNKYCIIEAEDAIYGISYAQYTGYGENKMIKYSLSEKTQEEEYRVKGKPQHILSTDDKIVIVSLLPTNNHKVLVEFKEIK